MRFLVLLLASSLAAQDVRIDLIEPIPQPSGAQVFFSTQNFFPQVGDQAVLLLSETVAFRAQDIIETKRLSAPPALFSGLPDGVYYVRGHIESDGLISPHSNVVSFHVQTDEEPLPVPVVLIEDQAPVTGEFLHIRFTPIDHLDLLHFEFEVDGTPNFNSPIRFQVPSNEMTARTSVSSFSGEGFIWVRGRGVFREGPGDWSSIESIAYRRVETNFYVLPHVAIDPWVTRLFLSVPSARPGAVVNATASYLRPSSLPGVPSLTTIPLSIRAGEFYRLDISEEIQGAPIFFESELPLVIAVHYVDGDRGGVLQVPRFEKQRRQALTGLIWGPGITSGLVAANTSDEPALLNYEIRVDTAQGNVYRGEGALLVQRYEEQVFLLDQLWPGLRGIGEEAQVSLLFESSGAVALLGGTFYDSNTGVFPSYFLGVEVHEQQQPPLKAR